jgi:hypothetical protein
LSFFLSWVCLKLTFPMRDDHRKFTFTTSFILQRIKTFLFLLEDCISYFGYTTLCAGRVT